jgi:ferredoxin-type protein NapH
MTIWTIIMKTSLDTKLNFSLKSITLPVVTFVVFWVLAVVAWRSSGFIQPLILFGYIGTAVGGGLGLYGILPKKQRPAARRITLLAVGAFLIGFVAVMGRENIQFEGFIFGLATGFVQASVTHYLIAKVFGPMIFGRLWCGWACWTVMVLDLLPFKRSHGRQDPRWEKLRYLHAVLSAAVAALLVYGFGYTGGISGRSGLLWFAAGNLVYYAVGIVLAYTLKDNRAFCKYLCPVAVLLKITSRFSLLKIEGDPEKCNDCLACEKLCPMDVHITAYHHQGTRVLTTECSLCLTCISTCSQDALKMSFGFDLGGKDFLTRKSG